MLKSITTALASIILAFMVLFTLFALEAEASIKPPKVPIDIRRQVDKMCILHNATDCDLVQAIAWRETRHRNIVIHDVTSLSFGPMQVKCSTARTKGMRGVLKFGCEQLRNPKVSLRFAIYYLEHQLKRYEGDVWRAISAYNMGSAHVCKDYNPGHCYPKELYNYKYVNDVWRRYTWLKRKKQKQTRRFLLPFKQLGGLETSPINSKLESQTTSVVIGGLHLELR